MAREDKIAKVKEIKDIFESNDGIIFNDHIGLNAENTYSIRNKIEGINAKLRIIKNSLTLLAVSQVYKDIDFSEVLTGPTSIISGDDIMIATKLAKEFTKEFETFSIKAGIIDGKLYDSKDINKLAALPSKEVLIAQFIGLLTNPLARLVTVLNNATGNLVVILDIIRKQKEQQQSA